ncbi:hypothetical protein [Rhizomonospora bruguierae]|uniref:hypothetical protein n=1 Tax=Rhizomonospora bruguierae TaxID=1581705 RepID=UPI001BCF7D04|nr:hypothetical protein [Micromonospora sp. NBRC 107566]
MQTMPAPAGAEPSVRHPLDPDPIRSTKAGAVFALGLAALLTGAFVGGLIPGTLALLLAREARHQAYAAKGYLTGARWIRRGEILAWIGLVLGVATLTVAVIIGLFTWAAAPPGQDFAPGTN